MAEYWASTTAELKVGTTVYKMADWSESKKADLRVDWKVFRTVAWMVVERDECSAALMGDDWAAQKAVKLVEKMV